MRLHRLQVTHTLALDRKRRKVYAFLPHSHRAAVFSTD